MELIDYKAAGFWLDLVQWLTIGVLAVWGYLRTKDGDNARAVTKVATELAEFIRASSVANEQQNTRITTLEEAYRHLPTDGEVSQLGRDLAGVSARVTGMGELLQQVRHQTTLIHEHLLRK